MYIYHTGQKKVCADMPTAVSHPPWTTKKLNPFPLTSQQGGGSHCPSDTSSENEAISTPGFLMTQYLSGGRKKKKKGLFCSQAPAAGHRCPPLPVSKGRSWSCSMEQQDYRGGKSSEAAAPSKDQVNVMLR